MADGTNLAGVIGTWVAVTLALIALFGVVTPILLIRRARSERHIALSFIDDESKEYVHPGIRIPFLPAIARTIHVPNFQAPPKLASQVLGRDDTSLDEKRSATAWIMFARTLKAYNIIQDPTGNLRIHRFESWLPVHRLWILTVGLLGRYGHRPDRGRLIDAPASVRIDQRDLESFDPTALYGITGVLRYRTSEYSRDVEQGFGQIYFSSHDNETRGSLEPDSVPLSVLFWLCMGCVPLLDGRVLDVSRETHEQEYKSHLQRERQLTTLPRYRFQPIKNLSPSSRVLSSAQTLLGDLPELWSLCKYTDITPEERVGIERISGDSDREGESSPWIKTKSLDVQHYFRDLSLLWRTDVQCLAFGILKMAWSPRGCLFDVRRGDFCRVLLCSASSSLRRLLGACRDVCGNSTVDRTELVDSVEGLLLLYPSIISRALRDASPPSRSIFSRARHEALYDFEQVLDRAYTPGVDSMAIGVIFITSHIFRNFVLDTLKEEQDTHSNILTVDPSFKYLTIIKPSQYKDMRFALDFDGVFNARLLPDTVSFTLEKVLFAALRACVRSVVFQDALDSTDLLEFVGHMGNIVHVAAVPNAPSKARGQLPPRTTRADRPSEPMFPESPSETTPTTEAEDVSVHELQDDGVHESTDNTISSGLENDERPTISTPERRLVSIEVQLSMLQNRLSDLNNGVHESTDNDPEIDERLTLSPPERERISIKALLDILQNKIFQFAAADTALQGRINNLRAALN